MLLGKKQRALERERDMLKKNLLLAQERNRELCDQIEKMTNPPEGCEVGHWCAGCKYAKYINTTSPISPIRDDGTIIRWVCLYGACEKRDPVPPFPFLHCG